MAYINLVLCKHTGSGKAFLFEAPHFSCLENGDRVIVATRNGETEAVVQDCYTVEKDCKVYKFICEAAEATLPLKRVLKECKYTELKYEEDNEDADKDE